MLNPNPKTVIGQISVNRIHCDASVIIELIIKMAKYNPNMIDPAASHNLADLLFSFFDRREAALLAYPAREIHMNR